MPEWITNIVTAGLTSAVGMVLEDLLNEFAVGSLYVEDWVIAVMGEDLAEDLAEGWGAADPNGKKKSDHRNASAAAVL